MQTYQYKSSIPVGGLHINCYRLFLAEKVKSILLNKLRCKNIHFDLEKYFKLLPQLSHSILGACLHSRLPTAV